MNRYVEIMTIIAILVFQALILVGLAVLLSRLSVSPIDVYKRVEEVDAKITTVILDRWTGTDQQIFMDQLRTLNPNIMVPIIEED